MVKFLVLLLLSVALLSPARAAEPAKESPKQQFVIVLKLAPHLLDDNNWKQPDNQAVEQHFAQLQQLQKEGKLILAGRTITTDPNGMGLVIVEVDAEADARRIMENDAAVKAGVMSATLFPFRVALIR